MSKLWCRTLIDWKQPRSWVATLSQWLRPHLNERGIRFLQKMGEQDLCWDDSAWRDDIAQGVLHTDVEEVVELLSDGLSFGQVRVYHGCRTDDAGSYHREGVRLNAPAILAADLRKRIADEDSLAFLRSDIEQRLAEFDDKERDAGRVYLAFDDRVLIESAGHYLLYGSEWQQCILGFEAHSALLHLGSPTIIHIHLPLSLVPSGTRKELACTLLQEWAHVKVNKRKWVPKRDFTFILHNAVLAEMVVGHAHPEQIKDPFHHIDRRNDRLDCLSCREIQS